MKVLHSLSVAGLLLVMGGAASAQAFTVDVFVDEAGNGRLTNTAGFDAPLPFTLEPDIGPGGQALAATYNLLAPPGLTDGDLFLTDPINTALSDVIRFNSGENLGSLVFYSTDLGGEFA